MKNNTSQTTIITFALISLLTINNTYAEQSNIYPFVSLGLGNTLIAPQSEGIEFNADYRPSISMGLANDWQLDENWLLTTSVALSYSSTDFEQYSNSFTINNINNQGQLKELGLWATTKVKRENLFSGALNGMSPFISVSIAAIDANYQTGAGQTDKIIPGYKITTGLEFELTSKSTFSIGVGYSDFDELSVLPNNQAVAGF
ncbi:MAG: hypothetical protein MJK12_10940 [Colwellia sp.]|nr:hypothetical protein [Colwellia sp.]